MLCRSSDGFARCGGELINGLDAHIHERVHLAPDDLPRCFIERRNLVSLLYVFDHHLVVDIVLILIIEIWDLIRN